MEQKRLCPFCIGELPPAATVCPHCGKILEGCNPAGCLPVGTVLAGRYTVGEMRSLDGEVLQVAAGSPLRVRIALEGAQGGALLARVFEAAATV